MIVFTYSTLVFVDEFYIYMFNKTERDTWQTCKALSRVHWL